MPVADALLLGFGMVREAFFVLSLYEGQGWLEPVESAACQLDHLFGPDKLDVQVFPCKRKDGTGEHVGVHRNQLGLLDAEICEELCVLPDVTSMLGFCRNGLGREANLVQDLVVWEETSLG